MPCEWRQVPGCGGRYDVSSDGQVRSWVGSSGCRLVVPRPRKVGKNRRGYLVLCIRSDSGSRLRTVHSLLAEAFIGPRPDGFDVNHIDGDKTNNRVGNLEYTTKSANEKHAQANLLKVHGERVHTAKLTSSQVIALRREHRSHAMTLGDLARKYGITRPHVCDVVAGRVWKHLPLEAA